MEGLRKAEASAAKALKALPALPANAKKAIVEYAWVGVLITIVLCVVVVMDLFRALSALDSLSGLAAAFGGSADLTGTKVQIYVMLAVWIAAIALQVMAISPLKNKQYKGWQFALYAAVILLAFAVVAFITNNYPTDRFIITLLLSAGAVYTLFQVRDHYIAKAEVK